MKDYETIIQKLIKSFDLDVDLERKKAFNKCVEYADKKLRDSLDYNFFVSMAAKTLDQSSIFKDIASFIQTDGNEKLHLSYSQKHGPVLCGNESGLAYLSQVLANLSKSKLDGDHIHLYHGEYPWTKAIRQSKDRMFVFTLLDDGGNPVSFAFDLDDTNVFLLTQKDLQQLYLRRCHGHPPRHYPVMLSLQGRINYDTLRA